MAWIDDVVSWISPRQGFKRARYRAALDHLRAYEGATAGRRSTGWNTSASSANADIAKDAKRLRENSRDLLKNNGYALRAISSLVANAIGTGIYANVGPYQSLWDRWVDECDADGDRDFFGLQELVARSAFESGEVFVRLRQRREEDGLSVPLQLQVLEADYLDTTKSQTLPNGGFIIHGIEVDALGRRAAYWMFPQHPGESGLFQRELKSRRIPATSVLHVYEKTRPGQMRGVPRLAAAIVRLKDLADYEDAELVRKKIEACLAGFVTTSDESLTLGTKRTEQGTGRRIEQFEPGMIEYLQPGEAVTFNTPSKSDGYGGYTQTQLRAIAASIGVTYEQMTGDLSMVNYSSMRAGLVEFRRMVQSWQWLTFIPQLCRPTFDAFKEQADISGRGSRQEVIAKWTPPKWEYVNPAEDVKSSKEAVMGGLKSLSECIREQGYEPMSVFAEIAEERKQMQALGITVDTTVQEGLK